MYIISIYDDNCAEAIFRYTDLFYDAYDGWCLDNRVRLSPLEWILSERFEDFRNFCMSKFDFDVSKSLLD